MNRKITIKTKGDQDKINTLCLLQGKTVSKSEIGVLEALIAFSTNNSVTTTPDITKQMRGFANVSESTFNTAVYRLTEKKLINKSGKTILISPIFYNISELTGLFILFETKV